MIYTYQATAGQMGVGTSPGNAAQLMSISGTIGGLSESASYTYDNYGRLVTSNQASNGSNAQRRFAYDRWANRTGVWNATSGGNQIQSISLQTVSFPGTGGAPTNRITSVTSGTTLNYGYDANGNLTNDGLHTYNYDSENRMMNVDNGAVSYAYDHQNRRYKKTAGSNVTHYVWEGNQVVGEYNGSSGAVIVTYVYAGSRLIGKTGSTTQVLLSDPLSVRLTLSDVGVVAGRQDHLPFGEEFAESGSQEKHHFTSYESDGESGTDYAVNRQYSQSVGRFMRVDPKSGSLSNPQSLDRYSYVKNDPIRLIDPLGLDDFLPGSGSGVPWDWLWLYGFSNLFPDVDNSPPYEGPRIPVASIDLNFFAITWSKDVSSWVNLFFADNPNCFRTFLDKGVYNDFLAAAGNAEYADFEKVPANTALLDYNYLQLGLVTGSPLAQIRDLRSDLEEWVFARVVGRLLSPDGIVIGSRFHNRLSVAKQNETMVHELLHMFYGTHQEVVRDLIAPQYGDVSDAAADAIIDKWLGSDCTKIFE